MELLEKVGRLKLKIVERAGDQVIDLLNQMFGLTKIAEEMIA